MTSRHVPISRELEAFLAAPVSEPASPSAFHAHGLWTFGVVVMRAIRFRSKALIICVLFALPLIMLAHSYLGRANEDGAFSDKEIIGVRYNRALLPVLSLAQQLRHDTLAVSASDAAAAAIVDDKAALAKAYESLAAIE